MSRLLAILGAVYVVSSTLSQTAWFQSQEVRHPEGRLGTDFGQWIATDGTSLVARYNASPGGIALFRRVAGQFQFIRNFPDGQIGYFEGLDVQDDELFIGGPSSTPGYVFVFQESAGSWTSQTLTEPETASIFPREFGSSLQAAGDRLIIGAPRTNLANREATGAAFVFRRINGFWTRESRLLAEDAAPHAWFGTSVALDSNFALVGAPGPNSTQPEGAAYVFELNGGAWTQYALLVASDGGPFDLFGDSVALAYPFAFVSSPLDIHSGLVDAGAVYVFRHTDGEWLELQKLIAPEDADNLRFGSSLSADGSRLVTGTFGEVAFVFRESGGFWIHDGTLRPPPDQAGDTFGTHVTLGGTVIGIAAAGYDAHNINEGSVFVFEPDADCNGNGLPDREDIATGASTDCNLNDVPDECDVASDPLVDCNDNGLPDSCDFANGGMDCNANGQLDSCDIGSGASQDVNHNGVPDDCECIGDLTGDEIVGLDDLASLLSNFGTAGGADYADGDVDDDEDVDLADLSILLGRFGGRCD